VTTQTITAPTYQRYEELRARGSVQWDEDAQAWLVLGHAECQFAARREDLFAHPNRRDFIPSDDHYAEIALTLGGARSLILLQGEPHRQIHRRLSRAISANAERYRSELMRPVASRLLDRVVDRERVEFVAEFADVLPSAVIAAVLGLPWQDDETLLIECKRLNDLVGATRQSFGVAADVMQRGTRAAEELSTLLRPTVRARRTKPGNDLISELWQLGAGVYPDWGEDDVLAQCRLLFFAGSETTANFLTNAGVILFQRLSLWRRLVVDRSLVPRFVEEALRVMASVQFSLRIADADLELGEKQIHKGDRVQIISAAANRDPDRYACPHDVDLDAAANKGHMAFLVGPRTCPGAPLARAEGREVLELMLDHLIDPALDEQAEPPRMVGTMLTSWRPLHIRMGGAAISAQ
jgi:cytochrome P450